MSTESSLSAEEIKKCLKDAGAYEENMSYDDMVAYYKVIKSSENTAQEEEEHRGNSEKDEEVEPDDDTKKEKKKILPELTLDLGEDDISDIRRTPVKSPKLNEKFQTPRQSKAKLSLVKKIEEYDLLDCPPLKHKPLDIILYERKYDLPPYCNPKYSNLTVLQRAEIIHDFNRASLEKFYKLHRQSLNPHPWGKPILATDKLQSQTLDDSFEFKEDTNEAEVIYTSRSGRQTKRKVYTDSFLDDSEFKKSKRDEDKPFDIEKKAVVKRPCLSKLSNQDIMKRSKLFADLPGKSPRAEKLFDLLKQNEEKCQGVQQVESLADKSNGGEEIDIDIIPSSQDSDVVIDFKPKEVNFTPRRIPPPLRGRSAIGNRKQLSLDAAKSSNSSLHNSVKSTSKSTSLISTPSTSNEHSQKSTVEKLNCPICNGIFPKDEIEAHASSCGLLMETESNINVLLPTSISKRVKCDVCDKEMLMNTDYEVHVRECILKASRSEKL